MGTYDLTSQQAVLQYEGITATSDRDLIEKIIERVTERFERYCDRKFLARDYTYDSSSNDYDPDNAILDGLNNRGNFKLLSLPQYPIVSITTVRINETAYTESTGVYNSGWFIYSQRSGILGLRGYEWLAGFKNIELVYNAGFATIPADLEEACIKQVVWHLKQGKKEHLLGQSGKSLADGSISLNVTGALLPEVKTTLDHYGKIMVA
jgi:hypothetical protein